MNINIKGFFRNKHIHLNSNEAISIYNRKNTDAAGYLIRKYMLTGCSVVIYSQNTNFYQYISDIEAIPMLFTVKSLKNEIKFPYIENITDKAKNSIFECFWDYKMDHDLIYYQKKNEDSYLCPNPMYRKCFYMIYAGGINKDKIFSEGLFTLLLSQYASEDSKRKCIFFIDAPYRPITKTALDSIREAERAGATIICMYDSNRTSDYDNSRYHLTTGKNGKIYFKDKRRKSEIIETDA